AKLAIGRKAAPVLLSAIGKIEQDGGRHDGHAMAGRLEAPAYFAQSGLSAGGGIKAESRASGKHHRIDALDKRMGREQIGLARSRRAAQHLHARDRRLVRQNDRDARFQAIVPAVADLQARDSRNQVSRAGLEHWSTSTKAWPS